MSATQTECKILIFLSSKKDMQLLRKSGTLGTQLSSVKMIQKVERGSMSIYSVLNEIESLFNDYKTTNKGFPALCIVAYYIVHLTVIFANGQNALSPAV